MKQFILVFVLSFLVAAVNAQTVSSDDLKQMLGSWSGRLTYLDYTSNKDETINVSLLVEKKNENSFELTFSYPGESGYGGKDTFLIHDNGRMISAMRVIKKQNNGSNNLQITLEEKGVDGNENKEAMFQHIISLSENKFILTKLVKFESESGFFQRNQFVFTR